MEIEFWWLLALPLFFALGWLAARVDIRQVVRESRVAAGHKLGYKLTEDKFPAFRAAFDKRLLERLVFHVQEPIARRAAESEEGFRDATLRFVSDPRIHTEICSAINDAVYDYLHGEGFLDLPTQWRQALSRRDE